MCPLTEPRPKDNSNGACRNLTGIGPNNIVWTAYPFNERVALQVTLLTGAVHSQAGEKRSVSVLAFCK